MALAPSTRLGVYEITSLIGEGGMGQVYRATDTKLKRQVAIKSLPPSLAADHDRLARFQREAEVLASLNHPNIASIYGLEESGGVTALVMELVDGLDLSEIIAGQGRPAPASGAPSASSRRAATMSGGRPSQAMRSGVVRGMSIEDALPIARQIADALEAAHEQGIIHRDLKPANIKVRADGTVKVLDFGLAKALEPAGTIPGSASLSPTFTTPAMTEMGMILGTAAYMAPEQARGKTVDKRADIWAYGAVLYEMLTGRRAFAGEDVTDTIVSVISKEPDWSALPWSTPLSWRLLLRRCLEKDPRRRLRDIGEARLALEGANEPTPTPARQGRYPLIWASAAIAIVSLALAAFSMWNRPATVEKTPVRLTIALPPGAEITSYPAITRDGRTVAYVAQQGAEDAQLYLRDLKSFEARTVAGSSGAKQPFFSPDGKWVAFFAQGQLQKAEVSGGGAPIRVAEASYAFGGTWNEDDTIVYAPSIGSGLARIPAGGGTPEALTRPDGAAKGYAHVFPQALPGGRSLLFTVWGQTQGSAVLSLDSGGWDIVLPSTTFASAIFDAAGGSSGRLLLVDQAAGIRSATFDPAHPARTTADSLVLSGVNFDVETESRGWLATSNTGTAVFAPGNPAESSLVWTDRDGRVEPLTGGQDVYREVTLSPDGTKAVVRHGLDLWIHDLQRGTRTPLTSGNASNLLPLWSHDGQTIVFTSNRRGDWDIYSQPADGSGPAETLLKRPYDQFPYSILPDGTLLYAEIHPKTGRDLWTLSPDGKASPLRVTPFNETAGQFSPGPADRPHWVAYESDESGRFEVYVQSYPGGANRIPVSTEGGILPRWSRDGKELFYVTGDAIVSVVLQSDGTFSTRRKLFDRSHAILLNYRFRSYDISPDGKRFLMIQRGAGSVPRQLNVILNWPDERRQ
ncbi:MAG: protein kinase domain-containing protein [Acidobacteriota bacterium]